MSHIAVSCLLVCAMSLQSRADEPAVKLKKDVSLLSFPFKAAEAKAAQEAWAKSLGKTVVEKNSLEMELVLIPPGKFLMGSPANEKDRKTDAAQVEVTLTEAFWLGKTEVTQGQWVQVMSTTPWKVKTYVKEGRDYPATFVSWDDAQKFVKKLSQREGVVYRLPTEAEWEWCCRAGTSSSWSFGATEKDVMHYAWYGGFFAGSSKYYAAASKGNTKDEQYAHQVDQKLANPFGLHDMHGNVAEWCEDVKIDVLPGGTNPKVTIAGQLRVIRGGSWTADLRRLRSAHRGEAAPASRNGGIGFRVLRTP